MHCSHFGKVFKFHKFWHIFKYFGILWQCRVARLWVKSPSCASFFPFSYWRRRSHLSHCCFVSVVLFIHTCVCQIEWITPPSSSSATHSSSLAASFSCFLFRDTSLPRLCSFCFSLYLCWRSLREDVVGRQAHQKRVDVSRLVKTQQHFSSGTRRSVCFVKSKHCNSSLGSTDINF